MGGGATTAPICHPETAMKKPITDSERTENFLLGSIQHLHWFRCGYAILRVQKHGKCNCKILPLSLFSEKNAR